MYINQSELRKMIDKHDFNVTEIAVKVYDGKDPYDVKGPLMQNGFSEYARINTASEGWPEFLVNIKKFFMVVGDILGGASVVVSLVTIFIIIYINALTRRRQIGILKGIGISPLALEFSYIFQAFFYVFIGTVLALLIIFVGIKPYLDAHPIITPFADIVLVADLPAVIGKCLLVILSTLFSALFPARVIIKQNTLNAILGRN